MITDNYPAGSSNAAAIPLSNTLLGLLLRNSYPASLSPIKGSGGDTSDRGDSQPYFFKQVFASSNDYVLIYQVDYPQTPTLTTGVSNPYLSNKGSTNVTGTLSYPNGQPVSATKPVILQFATAGSNWVTIGNATITSGSYTFDWKALPSYTGTVTLRGWWNGDPTMDLNMALSANQTLILHP